ncbi:MAG: hypothetical protein WA952_06215 [Lewinella sp.]
MHPIFKHHLFPATAAIGLIVLAWVSWAVVVFVERVADTEPLILFRVLALISGLILESYLIVGKWRYVGWTVIPVTMTGLLIAQPIEYNPYRSPSYLLNFAGYFVYVYCLVFVTFNQKRITPNRSTGQAWLLSLSFVYWAFELFRSGGPWPVWMIPVVVLAAIPVVISGFHALSGIPLSKFVRTWLSVWCVAINLMLGIDYGLSVFFPSLEWGMPGSYSFEVTLLSYFLLGMSIIYIGNNMLQILEILPLHADMSKAEKRQIRRRHMLRFSSMKVPFWQSAGCLVYALVLFVSNYVFGVLPRITMIWLVIVTFPPLIDLVSRATATFAAETPTPDSAPPARRSRGRSGAHRSQRSVRFPRIES